jgi:hypothetical protein
MNMVPMSGLELVREVRGDEPLKKMAALQAASFVPTPAVQGRGFTLCLPSLP